MSFRMDYKDYGSTEKTLINKEIFWKHQDNQPTWKDIKHIEFQDNDKIAITYDEGDEDSSNEGWYISVERWEEETDEQFAKRLQNIEKDKERSKKMRYESYLRLKAEFENEG
jgi:molecular chaperone GrpE (heat shock protein)